VNVVRVEATLTAHILCGICKMSSNVTVAHMFSISFGLVAVCSE